MGSGGTEGRLNITRSCYEYDPLGRNVTPVVVKSERDQSIDHLQNCFDCCHTRLCIWGNARRRRHIWATSGMCRSGDGGSIRTRKRFCRFKRRSDIVAMNGEARCRPRMFTLSIDPRRLRTWGTLRMCKSAGCGSIRIGKRFCRYR